MPNRLLETEVKVGIEMKITIMIMLDAGVEIETIVDLSQGEEKSLGPNLIPGLVPIVIQVRCYRCQEYDHFVSKCPYTQTDEETDYENIDPASLQMMTQNYGPVDSEGEGRIFKLVKGKNGSSPYLPMKDKTGGKVNYIKNKEAMCLTERQADHVYKVIEEGDVINTKTMTCETAQIQDDNPYKKVVLNKVFKEEDKSPEMRNWSILVTKSGMCNMTK